MSLSFSQNGFHLGDNDTSQSQSDSESKTELNLIFVKTDDEMSPLMKTGLEVRLILNIDV